jgi:RHS repeat-associated protein
MLDLHGDTFEWYPLSRLWTRKGLGRSYVYAYTASGERLVTLDRLNDRITITLRDLDNRVIRELVHENATFTWSRDWIHAGSRLLASIGDDGTRHYHLDHLGTPRLITDQSGNELSYEAYTPYGLPLMGEGAERLQFTGHERDVGYLDYMHARYYSAADGRFLSVDPAQRDAGISQQHNRYLYSRSNPILLIDPNGAEEIEVIKSRRPIFVKIRPIIASSSWTAEAVNSRLDVAQRFFADRAGVYLTWDQPVVLERRIEKISHADGSSFVSFIAQSSDSERGIPIVFLGSFSGASGRTGGMSETPKEPGDPRGSLAARFWNTGETPAVATVHELGHSLGGLLGPLDFGKFGQDRAGVSEENLMNEYKLDLHLEEWQVDQMRDYLKEFCYESKS